MLKVSGILRNPYECFTTDVCLFKVFLKTFYHGKMTTKPPFGNNKDPFGEGLPSRFRQITPSENERTSPEDQCLEDVFPIGNGPFLGEMLVFWGCT